MENLRFNKPTKKTKVVVAMSGGVDSSVVAVSLKKMGYDVIGVTMQLYSNLTKTNNKKSCCAGKDISDAINIAKQYDFPHHILNYQEEFYNQVIDNFIDSYSKGETPIPCIKCNQTVKFNNMLNFAKQINADALVTGHYVRRVGGARNAKLFTAIDQTKDQSYFLFATTNEQLDYLRFPLGDYTKEEVRKIAIGLNLGVSSKPDSQDICFITNGRYSDFIGKLNPGAIKKGKIINKEGEVIGIHEGTINYTIGQRKKIGIGGNIEPLYVLGINAKENTIVVGKKKDLMQQSIKVKDLNWISSDVKDDMNCKAKIRSTQTPFAGKIKFLDKKHVSFKFNEAHLKTSPGQACVFYNDDEVLGGGWITS